MLIQRISASVQHIVASQCNIPPTILQNHAGTRVCAGRHFADFSGMNEMLGNHHFLLRNYAVALAHYEEVLSRGSASLTVRKRAIVCYIQVRKIRRALALFADLISDNITCIVGQDNEREGCPCPEIIQQYERQMSSEPMPDDLVALGMLWLYCEPAQSGHWFSQALDRAPNDSLLQTVIAVLSSNGVMSSSSSIHQSNEKEL